MPRRIPIMVLSLTLSLAVENMNPAVAGDFVACLGNAAKAYFATQTAYQRDLLVERRPDFTALADINRDIQVLFAEMRFARLDYLLAPAPERLESKHRISKFRNFDWTEEDVRWLTAAGTN